MTSVLYACIVTKMLNILLNNDSYTCTHFRIVDIILLIVKDSSQLNFIFTYFPDGLTKHGSFHSNFRVAY